MSVLGLDGLPFDADRVGRENGELPPSPGVRVGDCAAADRVPHEPEPIDADAAPLPDVAAAVGERRVYRLADLANITSAREDYVVGGGIGTRGGKVLIHAQAGKGKTTFTDHLVAALAAGRNFLGRFPIDRPYRVGVLQAELVESELASHGQALLEAFRGTDAAENLEFVLDTQLRLPRHRDEVRAMVRARRWEVVCFDPALEFFEGESSDKAEQVGRMLTAIDWLIQEESLALAILVHHQNVSGGRTSGSWKFEGWPSTILRLEPVPGVPSDRMLAFEKIRAPGFTLPEKMQIRLGEAGYFPIAGEAKLPEGRTALVAQLLREAGGQLRRQELVERVATRAHVKDRAAIGHIAQAKQEGAIAVHQVGREAVYRLADELAVAAQVMLPSARVQT
jgi:hypothetical protein